MSVVKIKFKQDNTEIEFEVTEEFYKKNPDSILSTLAKLANVNITRHDKKVKKSTKAVKQSKGANNAAIIEALRIGDKDGMTTNDVAEATGLTTRQVAQIAARETKKGTIKTIEKGLYVYVKPKKADAATTTAAPAS